MIFGMVPLVLSKGEGSEIWNALGITVMGGLLVSWLVTLVLVPHDPPEPRRNLERGSHRVRRLHVAN
jgi:Cu/Ag efflux pump CusA